MQRIGTTIRKSNQGFSLIELMFVLGILVTTIAGMVRLFMFCSIQADIAGNKTIAISQAQNKLEEIRNHSFDLIATDYASGGTPGNTFNLSLINGVGRIYIDSSNSELLTLEVVVSWANKHNRIVGEDQDLDGVLDPGEDIDGNGKLDSGVEIISMVTRR